jgi:hypothetical protein
MKFIKNNKYVTKTNNLFIHTHIDEVTSKQAQGLPNKSKNLH